jgi:hypothetical protein
VCRLLAAVVIALSAACRPAPAPSPARTKPRLVVLVVIDQWPSWVFNGERDYFTGGLARLLKEGAYVPDAELPHANTFTAPGHATLGTGATPDVHGIVGNYWHRRSEGRDRAAEYDGGSPVFSVGPALGSGVLSEEDGASGRALRVEGVADVLERATGGASVTAAIALKPRAACLVAGQKPDLAIWYEAAAGGMTTSKAYASAAPAWLAALAKASPASRYFGSTWDARDRSMLGRVTEILDEEPGERGEHGFDNTFPHVLADSDKPERAIVQTPFADQLVAQTVAVTIDEMKLGADDVPDFLAVSFGAHDYAGHSWGPDSWEVLDLTMRLDVTLGELFDTLDVRVGADNWAVVVTSDHGATPLVERARLRSARRVTPKELESAAEAAIEKEIGAPGSWVLKQVSSNMYLTPKFLALDDDKRNRALEAATTALRAVPGVALAGRTDRFSKGCTEEKDLYRAICHAIVPGEAGELYAVATAGSVITDYKTGTGHDAPFDDNRRVPILVKAQGLAPKRGTGTLLQVAPTLAALLGIPPPAEAKAPTLFGIRRR